MKLPAFYGTRKYITVLTSARFGYPYDIEYHCISVGAIQWVLGSESWKQQLGCEADHSTPLLRLRMSRAECAYVTHC